jgi:hypothetical protein
VFAFTGVELATLGLAEAEATCAVPSDWVALGSDTEPESPSAGGTPTPNAPSAKASANKRFMIVELLSVERSDQPLATIRERATGPGANPQSGPGAKP